MTEEERQNQIRAVKLAIDMGGGRQLRKALAKLEGRTRRNPPRASRTKEAKAAKRSKRRWG